MTIAPALLREYPDMNDAQRASSSAITATGEVRSPVFYFSWRGMWTMASWTSAGTVPQG